MKFIYLISTIIFIVSCSQKKELVISDISKSQSFIIESSNNNPSVLKIIDEKAKLPMFGTIGSLNVSVACGAFLYEAVRQRS